MRLIAKILKTQPLHSPFADNIYHFWRLSKKYPHLFFHPLENQGKWEENAWSYDVADCIDKLKNALRTSLKTPPKRPVDTIKSRKTWFWHQRRGYNLGRPEPLPIAFHRAFCSKFPLHCDTQTHIVSFLFCTVPVCDFNKKLAVCLVAGDVGEGYYSVRTPRENGRKTHRDHRGQWWKSAITRPLWPRFVDRCNVVSRTYGSPRW